MNWNLKNGQLVKSVLFLLLLLVTYNTFAHGVSESDRTVLLNGGYWSYIVVGAKHMLTGYDHLLFLVGVIFFLQSLKDIVKFISVFTLGHSIPLIFATYYGVQVNEHFIDAIIGLTVVYKGFENLDGFKKSFGIDPPNLLRMVFIFGLIHGLGLSTRLQHFIFDTDNIFPKIISFNIGVEFGQILALIPIILIIRNWQSFKSFNTFHKITNWGLVIIGTGLALFHLYGTFFHDH